MATYKVLQDIEAEDKLLGPLTLRQFIYGCVAALSGYFCFIGLAKHAYILLIPFLPVMALSGFFAFPWGRDQPTEVWALAKIRFMLLPRIRTWNQSGAKHLVTITAPKKLNTNFSNNLSQHEVKSRLQALADTIDSRGWIIKNVDPSTVFASQINSQPTDRLVDLSAIPQAVVSKTDSNYQEDIFDDTSRASANFEQMINASEANRREQIISRMQAVTNNQTAPTTPLITNAPQNTTQTDNLWFLNQSTTADNALYDASVISPSSTNDSQTSTVADDPSLAAELKANKKTPVVSNMHLRTIQPLSQPISLPPSPTLPLDPTANPINVTNQTSTNTNQTDNAKIEESRQAVAKARLASNNDLNIATIAREAKVQASKDEIVISLH